MGTSVIQVEYGNLALENRKIYSATRSFEDVIPIKSYHSQTDEAVDINAYAVAVDREATGEQ